MNILTCSTRVPDDFRLLASRALGLLILSLTLTASMALGQKSQPTPSPTPRRPLAKAVTGSRGFDQFANRDASARLIAAAGTRVIVEPPGDHYSKGEALYKAGKYAEAATELRIAVSQSPQWDDPHYVLALSLVELGKLEEAIMEFKLAARWAIKNQPKILSSYNIGNAYLDLGKFGDAIEAYQKAIQINASSPDPPKLSKPHNNLGLAYAALGRLDDAIAEFNQAVELRADYSEAHYNLGVAYLQLGKTKQAESEQAALVKLNSPLAQKLGELIKNRM